MEEEFSKQRPLIVLRSNMIPEIPSEEESKMGNVFIKKETPEEREYRFILEKEVDQWYRMEEVVKKYAYVDESQNMIIFLTPMHC
jgi:NurA-like 5'-3' nuclease